MSEVGNAISHRHPGIVDADGLAGHGAWQASQDVGFAAAPFGCGREEADKTPSYDLTGIVDAVGSATRGARRASQVDDFAAAPLRGLVVHEATTIWL